MLEGLGSYKSECGLPAKQFYEVSITHLKDLPSSVLALPSSHFALFLACDARHLQNDAALEVARRLLDRGLAALSTWGPDCERVHDLFDAACYENEPDDMTVMTDWHCGESLDEALWDFVCFGFLDDGFKATCQSWVTAAVDQPAWARHIRGRLENSERLLEWAEEAEPDTDPGVRDPGLRRRRSR